MQLTEQHAETKLSKLCLFFFAILSFCGSLQPVIFLVSLQFTAIATAAIFYRKQLLSLYQAINEQQPRLLRIAIAWLLVVAIAAIASALRDTSQIQKLAVLFRITYNSIEILFFCVLLLAANTKNFYNKLWLLFACGFLALAAVHATAIALDPNPDAFQWLKYPLFNANIRESGMLAASAVLIFNSYGLMASERRMQLLLFIAAMLSWAYLFWTGGRMGIIVTLFTFAVILGFTHYKKLSDRYGLLLSLAAIALGFLLCVQLSIFEWNGLGHFIGSQQSDNFSSGRSMIWGWAFNAIGQHPWLGNGPFSFYFLPERAASHFIYDHPHNALLQFGLEWGLIGAALFIALLLGLFYRGTKNLIAKPATPPLLCALAIILMLSLHSLTSATYWSIQPVCLLLAAYGCIIRSQLSLVSEKPDKAT